MKKRELVCAGLLIFSLSKGLLYLDHMKKTYHTSIEKELSLKTLREWFKDTEERYKKHKLEEEFEKKRIEALKKLEEKEKAKELKKGKQINKGDKYMLEVSYYHDGLLTASGTRPKINHTIAAPKEIPFGSKITVDGQTYTVEDRGGYIKKVWSDKYGCFLYRVDIYVTSEKEAYKRGRHVVEGVIKMN